MKSQLAEIVQEDPSLSCIEIVEKCCGPQTYSHVFGFGDGVKAKDFKGGTSSKAELLSALCSTRDDNKFLNLENKSLNDRLSTLENKMKQFFHAQQSDVQLLYRMFQLNDNCFSSDQVSKHIPDFILLQERF